MIIELKAVCSTGWDADPHLKSSSIFSWSADFRLNTQTGNNWAMFTRITFISLQSRFATSRFATSRFAA